MKLMHKVWLDYKGKGVVYIIIYRKKSRKEKIDMKRVRCPKCDNFITFDETKYREILRLTALRLSLRDIEKSPKV